MKSFMKSRLQSRILLMKLQCLVTINLLIVCVCEHHYMAPHYYMTFVYNMLFWLMPLCQTTFFRLIYSGSQLFNFRDQCWQWKNFRTGTIHLNSYDYYKSCTQKESNHNLPKNAVKVRHEYENYCNSVTSRASTINHWNEAWIVYLFNLKRLA